MSVTESPSTRYLRSIRPAPDRISVARLDAINARLQEVFRRRAALPQGVQAGSEDHLRARINADAEELRANFQRHLDELLRKKGLLALEVSELKTKIDHGERGVDRLREMIKARKDMIAAARARVADIKEAGKRKHDQQNPLKRQIADLEKELNERDTYLKGLLRDQKIVQSKVDEAASVRAGLQAQKLNSEERLADELRDLSFERDRLESLSKMVPVGNDEEKEESLREVFASQMADILAKKTNEFSAENSQAVDTLVQVYEERKGVLQHNLDKLTNDESSTIQKGRLLEARKRDLEEELDRFTELNGNLQKDIDFLQSEIERLRVSPDDRVIELENQIIELQAQMDAKEAEMGNLHDVKIKLDQELEKYRRLLDEEEKRLHISATVDRSPARKTPYNVRIPSPIRPASSPSRRPLPKIRVQVERFDGYSPALSIRNTQDVDIPMPDWKIISARRGNELGIEEVLLPPGKALQITFGWDEDEDTPTIDDVYLKLNWGDSNFYEPEGDNISVLDSKGIVVETVRIHD